MRLEALRTVYFFEENINEVNIMLTNRPRGTNDFLPGETEKWQYIEERMRAICKSFGFKEIRTPIFEHT